MLNAYNKIANLYGLIASAVYGTQLNQAKQILVQTLPKHGNVLIIGGGNGEILQAIFDYAPHLSVTFVEASDTMLSLAKQITPETMSINFVHSDSFDYRQQHIDAIYAAFFFDIFSPIDADKIIQILEEKHPNKPTWHIADFNLQGVTKWKSLRKVQIKASILFFRLVANHAYTELPPLFSYFRNKGFKSLTKKTLAYNFLCIEVFQRP